MTTKDLVRGHLRRAKTAVNNTLVVGDSINNPYNSSSTNRNMVSFNINTFSTSNTLFVGQVFSYINAGVTTNGVFGGETQNGQAGITAGGLVRPGEPWPQTGETKMNLRTTKSWYASGDVTAAQLYWQSNIYLGRVTPNDGPADKNWCVNTTMEATVLARSSPNSPAAWNMQTYSGAGGASGTAVSLAALAGTANFQRFQKASFASSAGATNGGLMCALVPSSETENGTTLRDLCFLSFSLRNTVKTTGTFWGHCGYGSWKPGNHASEDGLTITADAPTYIGAYSAAALAFDYYCYRWNHVMVWIGANPDDANDLPGSARLFKSRILAIMDRHRKAANSQGLPSPTFTFVSQYFTSTVTSYFELCRDALYDIALHDTACELIDIFGYIFDTYATYAAWSTAGLGDGVHLKDAGAAVVSARMESVGFGSNTAVTPPSTPSTFNPVAGGPASTNKLTMIGKSHVYRSAA